MTTAPLELLRAKRFLRAKSQAARAMLSPAEVEARSRQVAARLLGLPSVAQARTIFCYVSHHSEVATHALIRGWLAEGRRVQVPGFDPQQGLYRPVWLQDFERDLAPGKLGILEPRTFAPAGAPAQIAIVPGVAFDAQGHRLGHGKGYYDEMLRTFAGLKIALAFDCQMQPSVPATERDVPMDVVVTETTVYRRS
ncbi:MAG: 5-formyltetrahydrofolate cyclo-ligase [Verrucomicrobiae bacterium]|nr:5-formyltetrahydrofolate cyclo-ligase [Verrucomicrobiae bacterium]